MKEKIGKSSHTFRRNKDWKIWPSDTYSTCEKFRGLSAKDRASVLEKNSSCSRCLSWLHKRDSADCRAPKNNCGADKPGGSKCANDHSKFVCGSGSVYCATAKFSKPVDQSTSSKASGTVASSAVMSAETLMLIEDVKVKTGSKYSSSRTLWDGGSNRVLVNNDFAREKKLRSQSVK